MIIAICIIDVKPKEVFKMYKRQKLYRSDNVKHSNLSKYAKLAFEYLENGLNGRSVIYKHIDMFTKINDNSFLFEKNEIGYNENGMPIYEFSFYFTLEELKYNFSYLNELKDNFSFHLNETYIDVAI